MFRFAEVSLEGIYRPIAFAATSSIADDQQTHEHSTRYCSRSTTHTRADATRTTSQERSPMHTTHHPARRIGARPTGGAPCGRRQHGHGRMQHHQPMPLRSTRDASTSPTRSPSTTADTRSGKTRTLVGGTRSARARSRPTGVLPRAPDESPTQARSPTSRQATYFTSSSGTRTSERCQRRLVDGSDSIVTYQTKESGVWDTIRDSTGHGALPQHRKPRVVRYVFDTGGDGAPGGGEFLSEEFVRTSGHWQTFDDRLLRHRRRAHRLSPTVRRGNEGSCCGKWCHAYATSRNTSG